MKLQISFIFLPNAFPELQFNLVKFKFRHIGKDLMLSYFQWLWDVHFWSGPIFSHFLVFFFFFFLMQTILKVFIEFVTTLLLCYVLVFWPQVMWDLSSPNRDWTCTLCIGSQSLNHWLPGKFLPCSFSSFRAHSPRICLFGLIHFSGLQSGTISNSTFSLQLLKLPSILHHVTCKAS